jgi:hypothetical protein
VSRGPFRQRPPVLPLYARDQPGHLLLQLARGSARENRPAIGSRTGPASTSTCSGPPLMAGCSAARTATPSSRPPGGRSGTRTRGRSDRGRVLGAGSGRRRHPVTRAVSACHPEIPASCQVSARFPRIRGSAPSRIRTCAHGSGGRTDPRL